MFKKWFFLFLSILFWSSPLIFWLSWQVILASPSIFWLVLSGALLLTALVAYEASGRQKNWHFVYILISLCLLIGNFYLFVSLLPANWLVQLFWFLLVWYLFRYLLAVKKLSLSGESTDWSQISLSNGLLTVFLTSVSLFGLQSFLSASPWLLLAIFLVILLVNTRAIAFSQGWNKKSDYILWPILSFLILEIAMLFTFLPLNYLIAGILCTLAYYSVINFVRLYLNKALTRRKIKNYAWFTGISLLIILLTARWF